MALLSFEDIIAASRCEPLNVPISGWGGEVEIVPLSKLDFNRLSRESRVEDETGEFKIDQELLEKKTVQACLITPALTMGQIESLWLTRWRPLQDLISEINKINGQDAEAQATAEAFPGPQPPDVSVDAYGEETGQDVPRVADGSTGADLPD
jgi:hypothetical protein